MTNAYAFAGAPTVPGTQEKPPAGCLHPSQGDVFTDPPPLGNFMQRVRGCAHAAFRTTAPQYVGAACAERLRVLVLSDTPSLSGVVQAEERVAHWQWYQLILDRLLPSSAIPRTACAGIRPAEITPANQELGSHVSYCYRRGSFAICKIAPDALDKNVLLCVLFFKYTGLILDSSFFVVVAYFNFEYDELMKIIVS